MAGVDEEEPKSIVWNFCVMAMCFSANVATCTALIPLASSVLNKQESGINTALLYSSYTLTATLWADLVVTKIGAKWAMFTGLVLFICYSTSYIGMYHTTGQERWIIGAIANLVSGIGAGIMWTAQAAFFNASARKYAQAKGVAGEQATALFASLFVIFYLGLEVLLNLATSAAHFDEHRLLIFIVFSAIAIGSALIFGIMVRDAGDGDKHVLNVSPCSKIASSTRVYCLDANVGLLAPYNMTFGFAAAFLNQYANAHVLDINQVGWFTALLVSSGFLFSSVSGCLGKHTGVPKAVPMLLGVFAFGAFALLFLCIDNHGLKSRTWLLVLMYIGFGIGRGAWENTMKAVFADFFGQEDYRTAAFANIPMQNGFAAALGFAMLAKMPNPRAAGASAVLACAIVGAVGYVIANVRFARRRISADSHRYKGAPDDTSESLLPSECPT
eukprot:m.399451 g.399451  ORF g.399451 m.399451 type:complete len:443 (+) comp21147_c1_seq8:413-1741(+)